MANNNILLLLDNRPGTASQAIALANYSGLPTMQFMLDYNYLANLPNLFGFAKTRIKNINNLNQVSQPKYIISAGRRSALFAVYLKNNLAFSSQLIQIMQPNLSLSLFDYVILPKHDLKTAAALPDNIMPSLGGLASSQFNDMALSDYFRARVACEGRVIALLIGGSFVGKQNFTLSFFLQIWQQLLCIANNMQAKLLVLNSRRTDDDINIFLKKSTINSSNVVFFDYRSNESGLYQQVLLRANYFVVTGDSVSMISEACSTGRPVYVVSDEQISKNKHLLFHQDLFINNIAKKFTNNQLILQNYSYEPLNEAKRIASLIFC
jgi:hypothetical protein